jgi:hypothetical protein
MVMTVTPVGDNPSQPFVGMETYIPDQLIAGNMKLITTNGMITGGANLKRGTVLGMVTEGSDGLSGSTSPASGNTGNGVLSAITFGQDAEVGAYVVHFTAATTYTVIDPNGVALVSAGGGNWGPDSSTKEIGFTFTAGTTPMAAGDEIAIIATPGGATGFYKMSHPTATDGSENPCAILVDQANAVAGDVNAGIYQMGEFNGAALIYDAGFTIGQLTHLLRPWGIFVKGSVTATDPTTVVGGAMGGDAGGVVG